MSFKVDFRNSKMKVVIHLLSFISLSFIFCQCSSTKNGIVQKRIYRPGWTVQIPTKLKKKTQLEITQNEISPLSFVEENVSEYSALYKIATERFPKLFSGESNLESKQITKLNSHIFIENEDSEVQSVVNPAIFETGFESNDEPKAPIITVGVIAFIIALINLLFFMWVPFLGVLSAILSIVFAVKALKLDNKNSKLYGITSIVISAFTIFISFLLTLLVMNGLQLFGNI